MSVHSAFEPRFLVIAKRGPGTKIARLDHEIARGWWTAWFYSIGGNRWTKHSHRIKFRDLLGSYATQANRRQARAEQKLHDAWYRDHPPEMRPKL